MLQLRNDSTRFKAAFRHRYFRWARGLAIALAICLLPMVLPFGSYFSQHAWESILGLLVVLYPLLMAAVFIIHYINFIIQKEKRTARWTFMIICSILLVICLGNISFTYWACLKSPDQEAASGLWGYTLALIYLHGLAAVIMEICSYSSKRAYHLTMTIILALLVLEQMTILTLIGYVVVPAILP